MSNTDRNGGIGFVGLLQLALIILKLADIGLVSSWSWFWVFAPLWGAAVLVLISLVVVIAVTR